MKMSVTGVATLVVDLGNSETRAVVKFGVNSKGQKRVKRFSLPNVFYKYPDEDTVNSEVAQDLDKQEYYNEDNSSIFVNNKIAYCSGELAIEEHKDKNFRPTALDKKYNSLNTVLSFKIVFLKAYEIIADWMNCDVNSVDVTWNVSCLMPPQDMDEVGGSIDEDKKDEKGSKLMISKIREVKDLEFLMPEVKKEIVIDHVRVFPEGFCALIAVLFKDAGVVRKEYADLLDDDVYTMIVDIGAGTTDCVVSKGRKILPYTKFTVTSGGNNVHQSLRNLLKKNMGIVVDDAKARRASEVGVVRKGAVEEDVTKVVNTAKEGVAAKLENNIVQFLETTGINIQDISYILVCGGGSENSVNENIKPISEYLIEFLKEKCPEISLVELPKELDENGNLVRMSPRLLNIVGASIMA